MNKKLETVKCPYCGKDGLYFWADGVVNFEVLKNEDGKYIAIERDSFYFDTERGISCYECNNQTSTERQEEEEDKLEEIFKQIKI